MWPRVRRLLRPPGRRGRLRTADRQTTRVVRNVCCAGSPAASATRASRSASTSDQQTLRAGLPPQMPGSGCFGLLRPPERRNQDSDSGPADASGGAAASDASGSPAASATRASRSDGYRNSDDSAKSGKRRIIHQWQCRAESMASSSLSAEGDSIDSSAVASGGSSSAVMGSPPSAS